MDEIVVKPGVNRRPVGPRRDALCDECDKGKRLDDRTRRFFIRDRREKNDTRSAAEGVPSFRVEVAARQAEDGDELLVHVRAGGLRETCGGDTSIEAIKSLRPVKRKRMLLGLTSI